MTLLAYDRTGSVRTFDDNGRLRVERTPISKANICEYLGREIPDHVQLGLDPDQSYRLLRDPKELEKAADSFNSLPVLEEHVPTSADAHPKELTVGSTMDNARFESPYLTVGMVIFDGPAIARIQSGTQRELSCGYAYEADMTPGTHEGQPYDGRMVNIRGNHVALVEKGRAGPDVLVHDSAENKENQMENENPATGNIEQIVNLLRGDAGDTSDDQLRAAVTEMLANLNKKTAEPGGTDNAENATTPEQTETPEATDGMSEMLAAMKGAMENSGCTPEQIQDCLDACKASGGGMDNETPASAPNSGTPARKEADDEEEKERRRELAQDAAIQKALAADRALRRAADDARRLVRPLVGEVHGMDSAVEIYRYALRQGGMAMDGIRGVNEAGLKALVNARLDAARPAYERPLAQDSAAESILSGLGIKSLPRTLS